MKKLLLLATLFVSYSASSQVILSENFEGVTMPALPAGWTSTTAVDGVWETGDAASANAGGFWPVPAHTQFAMANDDVCNCDMVAVFLNMPAQDFTGLSGVTLSYEYYDDGGYSTPPHYVDVSIDGGANWTTVFTGTVNGAAWQVASYALPAFTDGQSAVLIRFIMSDGGAANWGSGAAIDDIVLEVPASPYDAEMTYGDTLQEYTQVPLNQVSGPIGSQGSISATGSADVTGATMTVNVYDGTMANVYNETSAAQSITAGNIADFTVAGYTPSAVDVYTIEYICSIAEADNNTSNDTTYAMYTVTDSTYARDMGTIDVSLGIGLGSTATLGNNYTMNAMDTLTSVSFYSFPTLGDTVKVSVYDVNAGVPNTMIGQSAEYIITPADTSSQGMMLTLTVADMSGAELILNPGDYYVGIEEYQTVDNMALAQSLNIFTYNTIWGNINGGAFSPLEFFGFPGSFIVRPNFGVFNCAANDVTAPVPDEATLADLTAQCQIDASITPPTASDECAGTITGVPDVTFPLTTPGTTVVTWTYDDGNGNTSTQTQNMTITDGVDVSIINLNDTLTVAEVGATYQWIDCDNGNQAIPGETNQSFAPTAPGNYAVEVSNGTCTATSECVFAGNAGLNSVVNANGLEIYPNPSAGDFNVAIDGLNADNLTIEVSAVNGQIIASNDYGKVMGTTKVVLDLDVEAGTYFVRISADGETVTERIIVQ